MLLSKRGRKSADRHRNVVGAVDDSCRRRPRPRRTASRRGWRNYCAHGKPKALCVVPGKFVAEQLHPQVVAAHGAVEAVKLRRLPLVEAPQ